MRNHHVRAMRFAIVLCCAAGPARAETIVMEDGRTITATILKQDEKTVTVDWFGVPVTYWREEILRIEGDNAAGAGEPQVTQQADAPHAASMTVALPPDERALMEEVLTLSGIPEQGEQIAAQFEAQVDQRLQQRQDLPPAEAAFLKNALMESHHPELFAGAARERFTKSFDVEKFSSLRAWFQGPLGLKMRQYERAASGPEAAQAAEQFFSTLQQAPPSPERVALIDRLDRATNSTETTLNVVMAAAESLWSLGAEMNPAGAARERRKWELQQQQLVAQQREVYNAAVVASLLFTYRDATDQELEQYIAFWESDLGQWMSRLTSSAVQDGTRSVSDRMGREMIKRMEERTAKAAGSSGPRSPARPVEAAPGAGGS